MDYRIVLVEAENKLDNTVIGNSGILINQKYVITTCNILFHSLNDKNGANFLNNNSIGLQDGLLDQKKCIFTVTWKNDENLDVFHSKTAKILCYFTSNNIIQSSSYIFRNWSVDSVENVEHLNVVLSKFIVLIVDDGSLNHFKNCVHSWFNSILHRNLHKGQIINCRSVPFGNRHFYNFYSQGIVSNIQGESSCFIFSDCPITPGSEGSPIYISNTKVPIGIVLSAVNWWKCDWLGLTLIADVRPILLEICGMQYNISKYHLNDDICKIHFKLMATVENCLVQIYSRSTWGTAFLVDKQKCVFVTNSHVVVSNEENTLFWRNNAIPCNVLFQTAETDDLDIAILGCDSTLAETVEWQPIVVSKKTVKIGDIVYSAGFPIFPKEAAPTPTLSRGVVSQLDPFLIKSTCCTFPGSSGGTLLDEMGHLVGIIVCNAKTEENQVVYSRLNMSIRFSVLEPIIADVVDGKDVRSIALNVKTYGKLWDWDYHSSKL